MYLFLLTVWVVVSLIWSPARLSAAEKLVVGVVENVRVDPGGFVVDAKMDTGADNSSLHATEKKVFKRSGDKWVQFQTVNRDGDPVIIERKLIRRAKIKRPGGERQKRPVVSLGICLGSVHREVEVTLVDRTGFRNTMIIGRSFMRDAVMVDPSRKYTVEPICKTQPSPERSM
jgi:hypothetical protein